MRDERLKLFGTSIAIAAMTAILTTAIVLSYGKQGDAGTEVPTGNDAYPGAPAAGGPIGSSDDAVIEAVKKADPAVVAITVSTGMPLYQVVASGSGFLVSPDGYIVTNYHVLQGSGADYSVVTEDGKTHRGKVLFEDPSQDLAILKIDGTGYPYLPFGDSSSLQIGQSVIAIGNALGQFRNTVSLGIVSGLARSIRASGSDGQVERLDKLIQTDAAINLGNSGGPLIDLSGRVIGVNIAMADGAENIGFAIDGNAAEKAVAAVAGR